MISKIAPTTSFHPSPSTTEGACGGGLILGGCPRGRASRGFTEGCARAACQLLSRPRAALFKPVTRRYAAIVYLDPPIMDRVLVCLFTLASVYSVPVPDGFKFPQERNDKKLEPVITPPVLPVLEHLERDPSTLLPNESKIRSNEVKPRFFGGGFSVVPSGSGGLTASVSNSVSGAGASQSASQSFSFGLNEGFSTSHSASQSSSFSSSFGSGLSGSQASSQSASFAGNAAAASASSSAALVGGGLGGGGLGGSQSASSSFSFNGINGFNGFNPHSAHKPLSSDFTGEGLLDIRHRGGAGAFVFPGPSTRGRASKSARTRVGTNWVTLVASD